MHNAFLRGRTACHVILAFRSVSLLIPTLAPGTEIARVAFRWDIRNWGLGTMRKPGCAECEQLFQEYSSATFAHVIIENRVKMAELRQEVTVALSRDCHTATHKRE